jgi:hypothetical protein
MRKNYLKQTLLIAAILISTIANAQWTQIGSDIDGEAVYDLSGHSVSLSSDGSVVAIGAYLNYGTWGCNSGHVRIYENQSGTWTQIGSDIDGEAANDLSGWSVSLSSDGSVVAIGAWQNDGTGADAGHVRLYTYTHTCNSYASIYPVADSTYTVPSGDETYITGGIYKDTIPNAMGCDSLITIYLTINTVYVSLAEDGITLTTNESKEGYRWIDCNDNNNPVPGETSQSFTATENGSYAVIVYYGLYIDTSMCYTITRVGINENEIENTSINIYPNPTNGNITVEGENINMIEVINVDGRIIKEISVVGKQINIDLSKQAKGIYLIIVKTEKGITVKRVVLE